MNCAGEIEAIEKAPVEQTVFVGRRKLLKSCSFLLPCISCVSFLISVKSRMWLSNNNVVSGRLIVVNLYKSIGCLVAQYFCSNVSGLFQTEMHRSDSVSLNFQMRGDGGPGAARLVLRARAGLRRVWQSSLVTERSPFRETLLFAVLPPPAGK